MASVAAAIAVAWVALLLVGQPVAAFLARGKLEEAPGPRRQRYRGSALGIGVIGLVSLALDLVNGRSTLHALVVTPPARVLLLWSAGTLGACGLYWLVSQYVRKVPRMPPASGVVQLLPRTSSERLAFMGVAVLAGVGEEFAIRGFCLFELHRVTGSLALAALLTTVGFGLGHAYQGVGGILRTTLVGAILMVPVLGSGSLIPSMLGHTAVDAMTGLWTYRLLRRWGLVAADAVASSPTAPT